MLIAIIMNVIVAIVVIIINALFNLDKSILSSSTLSSSVEIKVISSLEINLCTVTFLLLRYKLTCYFINTFLYPFI